MSQDAEQDDVLHELAGQIAEGTAVDWDAARQRAVDSDRRALEALIQIAALDAAHRDAAEAFDRAPSFASAAPQTWRHLTLLEKIGAGQFGTVYRAFDTTLQIDVALKLSPLHPHESFDTSAALQEARLLARIQHPHVVRVYGADETQGRAGIWMDLVRGTRLADLVKVRPLSVSEAAAIGIQLCGALEAVHAGNVLHGDIKAHNVIRREDGSVVLLDFGAGRQITTHRPGTQDFAGTLVYLAPEVLRGGDRSERSDIYSLGVLLFHLVTGRYPVWADGIDAARAIHDRHGATPLREFQAGISPAFERSVARATAANPSDRYPSARALEDDLRALTRRAWWPVAASIAVLLAGGLMATRFLQPLVPSGVSLSESSPESASGDGAVDNKPVGTLGASASSSAFEIDAAFYRVREEERTLLSASESLRVNDGLSLTLTTSAPTYLYVVNEDERDEAFLLFPLREETRLTNPLPAGRGVRIPSEHNWQVSSPGQKEHLVIFASRVRLDAFEQAFSALSTPSVGGPPPRLPAETIIRLRGVGGLTPTQPGRPSPRSSFHTMFTAPLAGPERAEGLWVRLLTVINPGIPPR